MIIDAQLQFAHQEQITESGLARCRTCGGSLYVRSRPNGGTRELFYGCSSYHLRGRSVCPNCFELPMDLANRTVIGTLQDELLDPRLAREAVRRAVAYLRPEPDSQAADQLRAAIAALDAEQRAKLRRAVQIGGEEGQQLKQDVFDSARLTREQIRQVTREAAVSGLEMGFRSLPIDRAIRIYEVGTEEERGRLYQALVQKYRNAQLTTTERAELQPAYEAAVALPRSTPRRRAIPR